MTAQQDSLDGLTQVYNRAGWLKAAKKAIQPNSQNKSLLFIDLDRFKFVNDSLGHDAGDELLIQVAKIIKDQVHWPEDLVGRMGGDEFVILLQHSESVAQVDSLASEIIRLVSQPISLQNAEVEIGASIGVSQYPQDSSDLTQLLKYADLAMYRAKHSGRNQTVVFQQQMIKKIEYRRQVQSELRKALKDETLELKYQPIFDQQSEQPFAVDVSISTESNPKLYTLEQEELFSIADESQVSIQLSEWLVEQSLASLSNMEECELELSIVVPIRPNHFHQKSFVDWLAEQLEVYNIAPERLVLQLNDQCLNVQRFPVEKQLNALSRLGIELAVQNYGSGNLSPLKLHDWPIDQLNLSPVFVAEITNKKSMESMAAALIKMGNMLNKKVVAYGVCTLEQQAFLMSHQCYLMQGPLLCEPLPENEVEMKCLATMKGQDEAGFMSDFEDSYD